MKKINIAKEIVEERTTAASMDEILEVEAMLDAGAHPESLNDEEPGTDPAYIDNHLLSEIREPELPEMTSEAAAPRGGEPPGVSLTIGSELATVRNYSPAPARYSERRKGGKGMAELKNVARYEADVIKEGIGWVIVWKTGRTRSNKLNKPA